ncbi:MULTISPECIES: ATP-binding protein [unclassified Mycobacterium]|uniref:ATP-binding protein n=1 Tax=unclassified Mycobacterium TaxID=2642494 RepID=UPI0007FCDA43|nr:MULTISPECIES: ATP-binding protein [unclassified Mycobacterium]OBG76440.1 DNA mismatch repair protein [Mycobacterium sp. E1214]OBH24485.1 DNA mismatch repair protein [Mycobacterium sp. E1319]
MTTDNDVIDRIKLAPDAGLVKSLGANHTLESAIADIVDNSVDAAASKVSIRLLTNSERLVQVEVLDNGHGMDDRAITRAMTIGHQREYVETDLGHFEMGLKAASFGHSDVLTVWSTAAGSAHAGRRIRRADFSKDFSCEVLTSDAGAAAASHRAETFGTDVGTSVIWTQIRSIYRGRNEAEARLWLANAEQALRSHLGLVFHRLIENGRLQIEVLADERDQIGLGIGVPITPIDPFGYATSGHPGYPKQLVATAGGAKVRMQCHIWPAKSDITGFRIAGKQGGSFQGFYIYRNDRLLQAGGWSDTAIPGPARQLARVELDDASAIGSFVTMNPEKHGLKFEPIFHDAVSHAVASDGTTFDRFLSDAESIYVESTRRRRVRKPAITPDKGFAPKLRKIICKELPMIEGDALGLQWRRMPEGEFLDVDLPNKTLWLNSRYRSLFAPEGGSLNDAPVMKALLYLLTHHVFEGQYLGATDRDQIALWKSVLGAAAVAEQQMRDRRQEG